MALTEMMIASCFIACLGRVAAPESDKALALESVIPGIRSFLEAERQRLSIPGMSAAIVWEGRPAWSSGFGLADVENDVPAVASTVYRIGGISRMITAVAVLQLAQSGRISLDESIREFVPDFPETESVVSIRQVLGHMSGIRGLKGADEISNRNRYERLADTLVLYKKDRMAAKPGERFINSSLAYNLLGLLIERATVSSLEDYLEHWIFKPSGMTATGLDDAFRVVPKRSRGYALDANGSLRNANFTDASISYPGDGMRSTVDDLAGFASAWLRGDLLSPELRSTMTTVQKTASGSDEQYGLGCFVREEDGRRIVGHAGWSAQSSTFLLILPDQRAAVVILANLERVDVRSMCLEVARRLLAEPPAKVTQP